MRPKMLEVEGLQSFRDKQTIDFSNINQNGLFGIFGNTGSGKSTILDAITLALYGKIKRAGNSTQGIININCNVARVAFTFEILKEGKRITYGIEREYKRKKGTDANAENKVARLIQIDGENSMPIADKQGDVNQKIEEILGLNHKDFTKAVVLPQNNFQEFLLLGNAERRKMLERVFYLEEYGESLLNRLKNKLGELDNQEKELAGELKRYQDASNEALKLHKEELQKATSLKQESDKKLQGLEKEHAQKKEVFELLQDLEKTMKQQDDTQKKDEYIKDQRRRLEIGNKANTLIEKINRAKATNKNLKDEKQQVENCDKELQILEYQNKHMREEYISLKEGLKNREVFQQNIALELDVKALEKDVLEASNKEQKLNCEIQIKKQECDKLDEQNKELEAQYETLKQSEIGSMCLFLMENLKDGDLCPVCGNTYHIKTQRSLKNAKIDIDKLEAISKSITDTKVKKEGILGQIQTNTKILLETQENKSQKQACLNNKKQAYKDLIERYNIIDIQQELDKIAKKDKRLQDLEVHIKRQEQEEQKIRDKKTSHQAKYDTYLKELEKEKQVIELEMEQKGFTKGTAEVAKSTLSDSDIKNIQQEIDAYQAEKHKLLGKITAIYEKLDNRSITKQEWQAIDDEYNATVAQNKEAIANFSIAQNTYDMAVKKNVQWNTVKKEHDKVIVNYRKHDELRKLLIGDKGKDNSFVDYIAEERLRYVAKKASELLGIMTQYNFALQLDAESGFRILDNKNGGISRSVNTLSGGETFLTSLALALSLSEQIQLKGQSPLEFFFLDEGFGSLDNELLDQVIDALERISKKERVIGVISHIPELRQRISQRVIVNAPTDDGVGSIINIEKG